MAEDYYKILGVEKAASAEEITKAYRKLARQHHPDLNPDDKGAKKRFQEIQSAYDCLNDPEKRAKYDQFGAGYEQMGPNPLGGVALKDSISGTSLAVVALLSISVAFLANSVVAAPGAPPKALTYPLKSLSLFERCYKVVTRRFTSTPMAKRRPSTSRFRPGSSLEKRSGYEGEVSRYTGENRAISC